MDEEKKEPVRVMALHSLTYCERLFYLEEVEEIRVADDRVYAGRKLHEDLREEEEERGEWTSMELSSESLGLVGKVDALRRRDGSWIPYEHKRGRCKRADKKPAAWPSDRIQVCAYGMLIEEEKGVDIAECRIRYHADNTLVRVPLDDAARADVLRAIERAEELGRSIDRPGVAVDDRLCIHCSLSPVCMPEEERLAKDDSWEPIRLFPADRELKVLHITGNGDRVSKAGDTINVISKEGEKRTFPAREIGSLVIHGYPQVSTQMLHYCARQEIPVHFITAGGRYVTSTVPSSGAVQRRIRQFRALADEGFRLELTRRLASAKVAAQLRYVLRNTRGGAQRPASVTSAIEVMRAGLRGMAKSDDFGAIRGYEGTSAKAYFSSFNCLLRDDVPFYLRCNGRNRRPPRDRFNALLGFGYALLHQAVMQAVIAVGLDPSFGIFHTPRSAAHPLVLDIMELFRVPVWDMTVIGSINRLQWNENGDFNVTPSHVWLSNNGRKKAIQLFETRLEDKWKHPVVEYSMSYARLIELEVRLLEKEWTGSPGVFARMKLR